MPPAKPNLRWGGKIGLSAALCLAGAAAGTGLYFANLSYVTAEDQAARAAAAARQAQNGPSPIASLHDPNIDFITWVAYSPDGKLLAIADPNGTIQLWNTATHHQTGTPITVPGSNGVYGVSYSPDGKLLATAGSDGTVRFWNTATHHQTGTPITVPGISSASGMAFSPDGKLLATADSDRTIDFWRVTGG